jgi:hypothetical protein
MRMKKIIFFLVACIAGLSAATAQINSYSFAYSAGTYSEISGGTVVYSGAALTEPLRLENYAFVPDRALINEIATVAGYPIGFSFNLGEQTFTNFAVSPNGFIYLGGAEPFPVNAQSMSSANYILDDAARFEPGATNVLGFSRVTGDNSVTKADTNTEISYLLSGSTGSRVLTIQFKKIILTYSTTATNVVDIQIRLYEADNKVELIFNDFDISSDFNWAEIGLKGNVLGNTKFVTISQNNNWSTATASASGNVSFRGTVCDNGATFTFTPPPACATPASQPTDLQLTTASDNISGSFTATEDADKYLVLMGKDISIITNADYPVDGVIYKVGDSINNRMRVIAYSNALTFNAANLDGSSQYNFYVYAVNSECLYGPKYRTAGVLSGVIETLPAAPTSLVVAETGFTNLKLAVEADVDNHPVIIAQNIGQWAIDIVNNQLNDGIFGTPTSEVSVGDPLEGGGTVIYKGQASGAIEVTGLSSGKLVNFAAWSYDGTQLSTTVTKLNVTTWATLPYLLNFGEYAPNAVPVGWENEGNFELSKNSSSWRGNSLESRATAASSDNPVYNSISTHYLQLAPGSSRLILSGNLTYWSTAPRGTFSYIEWEEKDSLVFLVKRIGDEDYTSILTINAANVGDYFKDATAGAYSNITIPIEGFGNDTVKVKIAWTTHKTASPVTLTVTKFFVEEKPDHEAPINLKVDAASIIGSQAQISWDKHAIGTESEWEVRYRPVDAETWSTPVSTSETNYLFTNLPTDATVEVQVRAVVALNTYSPWTYPALSFNTGRGLPYYEDFDYSNASGFTTNSGWTLTNSTMILWSSSALRFRPYQNPAPATGSALLPKFDFGDGSANYQLAFDLSTSGALAANDSLYVIVKTDEEDIILEKYPSDVAADTYTVALPAGLAGIQQVGFTIVESVRSTAYFLLDNVSITPTCPVAVSNAQASDLTTDGAKVSWEGDAEEWLVFVRKAGETTKNYEITTAKDTLLVDLDEATAYEVGITTVCAPGDTAKVTIVRFTTLTTIPCDQVTDIEAAPTTLSVTLTWESTATKFNVRFRETGADEWTERTVTEKTITFNGLTHNTDYEYTIQTVCSEAEGDVSEWTEVATVKTVEITCFEPTEIVADPLGYRSATLLWEGDAAEYELSWAKTGDDWAIEIVEGKSFDLTGLTPETAYQARIRSICAEGDTSVYSPVYTFTTAAIPACPVPTALSVSSITDHSAVLSWTADDANTSWSLRYRDGNALAWENIPDLEDKTYTLTDLTANTIYLWSVRAQCAETENESAYASQETFTTLQTGIASVNSGELRVEVSDRIISVLNPEGAYINNIRVYGVDGNLLQNYSVHSSDNVLIPTSISQKAAIVIVTGNDSQATFKVIVK